jgi:fatty acid-binding protein DegV
MKPILAIQNGRVEPLERVRTKSKALARLLALVRAGIDKASGGKIYLALVHGNVPDQAAELHAELVAEFQPDETTLIELTPAVATHVGPGVLGVAFYQD